MYQGFTPWTIEKLILLYKTQECKLLLPDGSEKNVLTNSWSPIKAFGIDQLIEYLRFYSN
jgi:hypothetical protein